MSAGGGTHWTRGTLVRHATAIVAFLAFWEYAMRQEWLPATFFGQPSGIVAYLKRHGISEVGQLTGTLMLNGQTVCA